MTFFPGFLSKQQDPGEEASKGDKVASPLLLSNSSKSSKSSCSSRSKFFSLSLRRKRRKKHQRNDSITNGFDIKKDLPQAQAMTPKPLLTINGKSIEDQDTETSR